ncbi:hypothetical protein E3E23_02965 [Thermococcus sp. CX2]|uniref:hypothetical protein n=1 Tax=Thermococcus sp. CX2 TaxID=163006 RepID=UPI00143B779B|nr:hypothetical protein [Thermococcus sp. CX2]NJE84801.1 hypothetical protein [Thermococcus sp. CX2]
MKMAEAVEKSGLVHYGEVVEEFEVPVRGFLFKGGKLEGVYIKGGIIPVTVELPKDINEAVLRGKAQKKLLIREVRYKGKGTIEVYIQDGYRVWPIHEVDFEEPS